MEESTSPELIAPSAPSNQGYNAQRSPIEASNFYSSRKDERWTELLARLLQPSVISASSADPFVTPRFKTFPKQDQAFQYIDQTAIQGLRTFALQDAQTGSGRRFMVCTYQDCWSRYHAIPPEQRHYYEVIREGSPCWLYFDLEFKYEFNPGLDGDKLVDTWIYFVREQLYTQFKIACERRHFLRLDSVPNQSKFSVHLIVHTPGAAFANNIAAGRFVRHLQSEAAALARQSSSDANSVVANSFRELFVQTDASGEKTAFFADLSVYTRNRHFRMYLSSKLESPGSVLLRSTKDTFDVSIAPHVVGKGDTERTFYASLICNVPSGVRLLTFDSLSTSTGLRPLSCATTSAALPAQCGTSPFPDVDMFIATVVLPGWGRGGGRIRSFVHFPASEGHGDTIVYNISLNRWCENIGREHKSNHIVMVVDVAEGIYYQKCLDPECREFRSSVWLLPREIAHKYRRKGALHSAEPEADFDDMLIAEMSAHPEQWP